MQNDFLIKADDLTPILHYKNVSPQKIVKLGKEKAGYYMKVIETNSPTNSSPMKKGDKICFDFGRHCVGNIDFKAKTTGNPPDNPAKIKIKFGETICEIVEPFEEYDGNISSSWLQEEHMFIDVLPAKIEMPRRYAFRYIEFEVLDTSHQFQLIIEDLMCKTVTSAEREKIEKLKCDNIEMMTIDGVAINTLEGCMQEVFEDGPKRDRRLWIGDLRLQALTNYETFRNYDLVKRCLYLFAGVPLETGKTGGCLYIKPNVTVDSAINLFDYSLFFVSCLYDYYIYTKDIDTLNELWGVAYNQIRLAELSLDDEKLVIDQPDNWWWCFVDWNTELNKQASAQAIYIFVLKQATALAEIIGDFKQKTYIKQLCEGVEQAALKYLWRADVGFFVSGEKEQISWATQVWFAIAGVLNKDETSRLLLNLKEKNPDIRMKTPYMNHCYIEALIATDMMEEAKEHILKYWGGMVRQGADCFWEVYDPDEVDLSAYGNPIINSYCHAWSCTPSYFIRKYFLEK